LYWAQALRDRRYATDPTAQSPSDIERELAELFKPLADELTACETAIVEELASIQGRPVEMCGYYFPDSELLERAMRPSRIFNKAIEKFSATASQPV
jgi:isocitrate dehydrogenase